MITLFETGATALPALGFNLAAAGRSGLLVLRPQGAHLFREVPLWLRRQFLYAGPGQHEGFYRRHFLPQARRLELASWPLAPAAAEALVSRTLTICYLEPAYLDLLLELGGPTEEFLALPGVAGTIQRH